VTSRSVASWKPTDVSEEHAFIFTAEEKAKQETDLKASDKQSSAGFLLGLFFDPKDGGEMFLQNVGWLSTDYTALYPRTYDSS
jgi:hypothetical protein